MVQSHKEGGYHSPHYEAVILAGGMGSRLHDALPHLPKCLAPVGTRAFLSYLIDYLRMQGVTQFIFSLCHRWQQVEGFLKQQYATLQYKIVVEATPLGTAGALQLALQQAHSSDVLVVNGDTYFEVDVAALFQFHHRKNAWCTLALKPMENCRRYGAVTINDLGKITSFSEKEFQEHCLINGGAYVVNKAALLNQNLPVPASFEIDLLERYFSNGRFFGLKQDGFFIDIGVPEDWEQAQTAMLPAPLKLQFINKEWTLFLDRDGVINDERVGHYVLHWKEFIFSQGVLETFKTLSQKFGSIVIVTNQRGVGRQLMSEADLQSIHFEMQREVAVVGGKIDKIYYCTEVDNSCFYRKPNPGMALQAKKDFPQIDFAKSIMVGNKPGDMRFGRAAGMYTVFVTTTNPLQPFPHPDIDMVFPSLPAFAHALES